MKPISERVRELCGRPNDPVMFGRLPMGVDPAHAATMAALDEYQREVDERLKALESRAEFDPRLLSDRC